jgi:2-oxoglutarate ferredoxin oxidoreductase subunit gamma
MRTEIRIAGFGGQGVGLAAFILGKALSLYETKEAVMTQSYGPEARGGASSANVVLADQPIAYPFVQQPDILIALSQEAYSRFRPEAKSQAIILVDQDLVTPAGDDTAYSIPATRMAEDLGQRMVANIIMLGCLAGLTGLVCRESLEEAIRTTLKSKLVDLNLKAFVAGYAYGREIREVTV